MNRYVARGLALAALLVLAGCQIKQRMMVTVAPADVLPEERAAMQTRTYAVADEVVFAATVAVLQDLGWNLDAADRASGIIRASTAKRLEPLLRRAEKRIPDLRPEDRKRVHEACTGLKTALESGDEAAAEKAADRLTDLLFDLEG